MLVSTFRRVGGVGRSPTIRGWIVSPARVQIRTGISSPDDHLTASPDWRVAWPGIWRVGAAGGCPRIINASVWANRYCGKHIFIPVRSPSPGFQWFLMTGVEVSYQTLSQHRPSQTLSDYKRIISQRRKQFA